MHMFNSLPKILVVAAAGTLIWWLAGEFGLVNTSTSSSPRGGRPLIKLLNEKIQSPDVTKSYGDNFKGTFVLYNEGEATANNCKLWLIDGASERFQLAPTEKKTVRVSGKHQYREPGTAWVVVRIRCSGYEENLYAQPHPH